MMCIGRHEKILFLNDMIYLCYSFIFLSPNRDTPRSRLRIYLSWCIRLEARLVRFDRCFNVRINIWCSNLLLAWTLPYA